MQTEVLDTLFAARDVVSDIIIAQTPADAEHKKLLEKLMLCRDQLTAEIQEVINAKFNKNNAELMQAFTDLENRTAQLKDLKNTIDNIASVISFVDQVIQTAGQIVALAA
jgi:tRNA A22 N-methylase